MVTGRFRRRVPLRPTGVTVSPGRRGASVREHQPADRGERQVAVPDERVVEPPEGVVRSHPQPVLVAERENLELADDLAARRRRRLAVARDLEPGVGGLHPDAVHVGLHRLVEGHRPLRHAHLGDDALHAPHAHLPPGHARLERLLVGQDGVVALVFEQSLEVEAPCLAEVWPGG